MADSNSFNDFVTCPYNNSHRMLRGRLAKHLIRCSRDAGKSNKLHVCPFNTNHRYKKEDLAAHIKVCPESGPLKLIDEGYNWQKSPSKTEDLAECKEDWDNEPDVPAYNPRVHCEENLIIRTNGLKGKSKAVRREFRENERRRFADKQ